MMTKDWTNLVDMNKPNDGDYAKIKSILIGRAPAESAGARNRPRSATRVSPPLVVLEGGPVGGSIHVSWRGPRVVATAHVVGCSRLQKSNWGNARNARSLSYYNTA